MSQECAHQHLLSVVVQCYGGHEVAACGFDLHFSVANDVEIFFMFLLPILSIFLWITV